jgi:UDP-N-acetylglucosamine 2-epimerase (non-hydrolysing)
MHEMSKHTDLFNQFLVHTSQHYDDNMSKIFFEDIELPMPDIFLGVGSGSHAHQTANIMQALEPVLMEQKPDWIIVVGDVNSTLACALTATKLGIKVAHVESGLRSFDRTMPEEYNRILTDHISDLLFTTEESGNENLINEGISKDKIDFVGNVMIDTLIKLLPRAKKRKTLSKIGSLFPREFALVTLHRPSNVDHPETLQELISALTEISKDLPIVFPTHPRTQKRIQEAKFKIKAENFYILNPLGYLDFLSLMNSAKLVITDSGGIQEETTYLGIPCLTVRPNTERPVTLKIGTNRLVPNKRGPLKREVVRILDREWIKTKAQRPPLWDGKAAQRIVRKLKSRTLESK